MEASIISDWLPVLRNAYDHADPIRYLRSEIEARGGATANDIQMLVGSIDLDAADRATQHKNNPNRGMLEMTRGWDAHTYAAQACNSIFLTFALSWTYLVGEHTDGEFYIYPRHPIACYIDTGIAMPYIWLNVNLKRPESGYVELVRHSLDGVSFKVCTRAVIVRPNYTVTRIAFDLDTHAPIKLSLNQGSFLQLAMTADGDTEGVRINGATTEHTCMVILTFGQRARGRKRLCGVYYNYKGKSIDDAAFYKIAPACIDL